MSQCYAGRLARHRRLESRLNAHPRVECVDRLDATESPRNHAELEVICETTLHGTAPQSVTAAIADCELEIVTAGPHNNPDLRQVVVR